MRVIEKPLADLTLADFDFARVWASDLANDDIETVYPVMGSDMIGTSDPASLWVRFSGMLADSTPIAGIATPRDAPPDLLLPSFLIEGKWHVLHLPPAPDFVLKDTGPDAFARALGRGLAQVFPIYLRADVKARSTDRQIEKVIAL